MQKGSLSDETPLYKRILVAIDGSVCSDQAMEAALAISQRGEKTRLFGCHVYAAKMHRTRFEDMEHGLPERYQDEKKLFSLRNAHDDLITEGMKLISDSYLAPLSTKAQQMGLVYKDLIPEGRNYVELLRSIKENQADLVVLGAWGHGHIPESSLGSLTERILLYAPGCDILVIRKPWSFKGCPIITGVDGSENSYAALKRAAEVAKAFEALLEAVAVYDPFFHTGVFRTIEDSLPESEKKRFNFPAQEKLHDEIIDRGLEGLYQEALERGELLTRSMGVDANTKLLKGKVYSQLHHYAALRGAGLLVMGRWGLHQESESLIGTTPLNIARLGITNTLVVSPSKIPLEVPKIHEENRKPLIWTDDAGKLFDRVPPFVRSMARKAVEDHVREKGFSEVTIESVQEVAGLLGMGAAKRVQKKTGLPEAQVVVLRKVKRLAPDFHRHILKGKIVGQELKKGQRILVYEVVETVPSGLVRVTEKTQLEFR